MRTLNKLTQERLKELLIYDPLTGIFRWRIDRPSRAKAGDIAGATTEEGYRKIGIDMESYFAHRLAFLYMTGALPTGPVDHIHGDRSDNRFSEIRLADACCNAQNRRGPQRNNKTGLLGVAKQGGRYRAAITSKGKRIYLGFFKTPEEAYSAYLKAKRELHPGGIL